MLEMPENADDSWTAEGLNTVLSMGLSVGCVPDVILVKPPFLCVRSRGLGESEDGENGRMEPESLGMLRWLAASAKAEGPRNRRARRPEQWPQFSATGARFRTGARGKAEWKVVKSPN
jgi:hypothetical protein